MTPPLIFGHPQTPEAWAAFLSYLSTYYELSWELDETEVPVFYRGSDVILEWLSH